VDPNDPIYQAMIAAAAAPPNPELKQEPHPPPQQQQAAWAPWDQPAAGQQQGQHQQQQHHTAPAASAPPAAGAAGASSSLRVSRARGSNALKGMFGDDEEEVQKNRKLKPINYSEEELRAVQEPQEPQPQVRGGRPCGLVHDLAARGAAAACGP
jgi:RNA-binding protein 25